MQDKELLARKYDKCLSNLLLKSGTGFTIGIGLSFLLFRRSAWPIALTTGFGAGMAYAEYYNLICRCNKTFDVRAMHLGSTKPKE
jgi:Domain of unknown function (DUF543)